VFMTQKSVDGLMTGKFTIGADASAAAGPVGRNASAATDARLKAEILSYSRSRGLFAGVSLDGTVIDMDLASTSAYYGVPVGQPPQQVPPSAMQLLQELTQATNAERVAPPAEGALTPGRPTPAGSNVRPQLAASAEKLYASVDASWRKYLALPAEVFAAGNPPRLDALQAALGQYDRVVQEPKYEALVTRPEFQTTYGLLREYVDELSRPIGPSASLPPPPRGR
jgi:SH3 domain-containing YSC84-like protein 1